MAVASVYRRQRGRSDIRDRGIDRPLIADLEQVVLINFACVGLLANKSRRTPNTVIQRSGVSRIL